MEPVRGSDPDAASVRVPHAAPGLLAGMRIALTGRMVSMTRAEAAALVEAHGAEYRRSVGPGTTTLVVGDEGWPLKENGRLTRKLLQAQELQRRGRAIEVLPEAALLERLGLEETDPIVRRSYSLAETAGLVGIGRDRLRTWIRAGLIEPVETRGHVPCFDLRQVIRARSLVSLAASGVSLRMLRRSLQQLQRWIPGAGESLAWLDHLAQIGGRLVIEPAAGTPFEPSGQYVFDFREPVEADTVRFDAGRNGRAAVDLFAAAVAHEGRGEFDAAAEAYRELLARDGPDAEVSFNLGNVLYALGELSAAAERFRQAVELDSRYAEAWNNLGNVLAECGRHEHAVRALHRAVALDPAYADASFGLADSLDELGRFDEARQHWQACLHLGVEGEWAEYARRRLQQPA